MISSGDNLSAFERNRLFVNTEGRFVEMSHASGVDLDADSRGAVAADFDRDGDPDLLVISAGGGALRLFRNDLPQNRRVRVVLHPAEGGGTVVGARLVAQSMGQTVRRDVFAPNGFALQSPAEQFLGLGAAERIDSLEVRWPSGKVQTFRDLPADATVELTEGEPAPIVHPGFSTAPGARR